MNINFEDIYMHKPLNADLSGVNPDAHISFTSSALIKQIVMPLFNKLDLIFSFIKGDYYVS